MKWLEGLLDQYNLRARIFPAALVVLPVALGFVAAVPMQYQGQTGIVVGTIAVVAVWLLADYVREAGLRAQARLYSKWGGKPSVTLLHHSQKIIAPATLARCHQKLRELDPRLAIPASAQEESLDRDKTLAVYTSCNELLLEHTRDKSRFALLLEENVRYGMRRNLFGVRGLGLSLAVVGVLVCGTRGLLRYLKANTVDELSVIGCVLCLGLVLFWHLVVTEQWVWRQAIGYAERLILSAQTISAKPPESAKDSKEPENDI